MAMILDGKACAAAVKAEVKEKLAAYHFKHPPALGVVMVGDNPASEVYVRNKKKDCEEVGLGFVLKALPANSPIPVIKNAIHLLNDAKGVAGIILQLPVDGLTGNKLQAVIDEIDWRKDVDGLTTTSVAATTMGLPFRFQPCTPAGVMYLLEHYGISVQGKHVVILGRSNIVGKPMAAMMMKENATVSICHSKTHSEDIHALMENADIIVSAVGAANADESGKSFYTVTDADVTDAHGPQILIDVGITRGKDGKLHGDIDPECYDNPNVVAYTPVPGGVGPMTRAMLIRNVAEAAFQYGW